MDTSKALERVRIWLVNARSKVTLAIKKLFFVIIPAFIKENFEIEQSKRSKRVGFAVSLVLMFIAILDHKQFVSLNFSAKWLLLAFCLVFPFAIGFIIAYRITIKHDLLNKIWHFLLFLLMPIVTMSFTECLNNVFIYDMTYLGFFGNYVTIALLYFLVFALSGSFRLPILIINPILFGLAVAHNFISEFRGTPFIPMDFLSITTAAGVANTYEYRLKHTVLIAALIFIFSIVLALRTRTPKFKNIEKLFSRVFLGVFSSMIILIFYFTNILTNLGVKPDFWNQARGYKNYGFVYNFLCNTKYLYMSTPEGYNPDEIGEILSETVDEENNNQESTPPVNKDAPNIICIMNESLADLKVLGDFTTNEDYMPFMHSLTENTVKGNLFVPVIGAGTSNTEFEFLTGHTTAFLPSGSNAYMLYIKNPIASIVSTLDGQGYHAYTMHPYYSSGWNRVEVYNHLGFDNFVSLENLIDVSIMTEYVANGSNADYLQALVEQYYPDRENMFIRQYISDEYNYDVLIKDFEKRDKDIPYFAFNVTMQNHGGYTVSASNFDECISITSTDVYYNKATKYLSLVKASDDAFKGLIEYFKKVDEPTVICMFGDHQPTIEPEFIASLLGVKDLSNLTVEQEQQRHMTPFFIWANYDIEEQYIERLSSNYLSSYVLDIANVNLTEYNKYLLKIAKTLPVIDTVGYIDNEGNHFKWSDKSDYTTMLNEYEKIQYNNIFETKNKDNNIFYLEGYDIDEFVGLEESDEE